MAAAVAPGVLARLLKEVPKQPRKSSPEPSPFNRAPQHPAETGPGKSKGTNKTLL